MAVIAGTEPRTSVAPELLARWRNIPVAVTVDLSRDLRQIDSALRPLRLAGAQPLLFGQAVTVRCAPPDFGAVLHGVDLVGPGDVLVIAATGFIDNAMIGAILCGHLRARGAAGVVCDGAIRDVATLSSWTDLPIYYRAVNPRGPVGASEGAVNQPVTVGGQTVNPGDFLIGDDDGLVVLAGEELGRWIGAAEKRLETEQTWIKRLEAGESMASLFELDATVSEASVTIGDVDNEEAPNSMTVKGPGE